MTAYRLDRSGVARLAWEAPEEETPEQRVARRYREGKCVGCTGSAPLYHCTALCAACWDAGTRYCRSCGAVVSLDDYRTPTARCAACHLVYDRERQRARYQARREGRQERAAMHEAALARAGEIWLLRARGWTDAEIARRHTMTRSSLRSLLAQYPEAIRVLTGQARADAMRAMLNRGMTLAQVGARFGITGPATWNFLRRWEGRDGNLRSDLS